MKTEVQYEKLRVEKADVEMVCLSSIRGSDQSDGKHLYGSGPVQKVVLSLNYLPPEIFKHVLNKHDGVCLFSAL